MSKNIVVIGAETHNLQKINVTIPRDKLVVVTGVSGSGKSSLAFDTIYAEGQRRYVESLSTYTRQFLQLQGKSEVESIEGLSPAISIDQKNSTRNPRSTVGTATEIYDFLRLLFAKMGSPIHPETKKILQSQSVGDIADTVGTWTEGEKFMILSPIVNNKKGQHKEAIENIKKHGFIRMRIDGNIYTIDEEIDLDPNKKHTIEIVVDRLMNTNIAKTAVQLSSGQEVQEKNNNRLRLIDSLETALQFGEGIVIIHRMEKEEDFLFSESASDAETGFSFPKIEPRIFSFNSPHGACESCHGLGYRFVVDTQIAINPKLSIKEGGIVLWSNIGNNVQQWYYALLKSIGKEYGFTLETQISDIKPKILEKIFNGFGDEEFNVQVYQGNNNITKAKFEGLIDQTERRYNESDSDFSRKKLEDFMTEQVCRECDGSRLNIYGRNVVIDGLPIHNITAKTIKDAQAWISDLSVSDEDMKILKPIKREIESRLNFLEDVGLSYLNLSRAANTLSGGESQRIRLATQIGSRLQGVIYILDEPSIGLHQRDNNRLIDTMKHLRDLGNTVIVVEHDEDTMRIADHIIEIGPRAGLHGGKLVYSGSFAGLEKINSETADFLFGRQVIDIPKIRRKPHGYISLKKASENNLKNVDVDFPLGCFVGVSGVSGSGKSSLVNKILTPYLANTLNKARKQIGTYGSISGEDKLDKLISINQSPIGRTPRSNPATYTGLFTDIRDIFSMTPEARLRGYNSGRFSFNIKGGRCEDCSGDGLKKIEMHFLPDVYVYCDNCKGKRYNDETLEITYKGKNISEVLEMNVEEASQFFESVPSAQQKLQALDMVGLSYIHLGQSATTLSGGEAQRVKLASELMKKSTGKTIYILDEPTTGLHFSDIKKLLEVLQRLIDKGNSVIVIEHNLDVLKCCDYLIDMGPEGGDAGGTLIATGTPEKIAQHKLSYTGEFLKKIL